ncbi:hypothetical protein POSPLADRAFT_1178088 [Postia placenta MAD-698-R-SB12]|uniref:Mediator complex subunit 27 n=1 Tax=Postia placenta MAD-698-R-SB12 TaxID=670580 RepID=A0A1X6NDE6_9APHY|nr:hypothetical protein POSPLADRAFT_1178088 [Postia placenta MAD-698-R-SB12]OSX66648.1 hypothetical protein POSPLADRAFT_1178088 [Postia placenta MAD-698-R-SB12]
MSDTVQASTELSTLQTRLEVLNALIERLRSLRSIPAHLIRLPQSRLQSFAPLEGPHFLPQAFRELKETVECVRSEKVQEALVTARDSEQKDKSDLRLGRPRVNRKRKRAPSPESPRSYAPLQPQRTSLFPADLATPPVLPDQLVELLKGYNKEHEHVKLHILAKRPALVLPVVVRYTIRDVAIIYLTLNSDGTQLIVENATAFGPREQKPNYSQSDFNVYQRLSQQITKTIQSDPQVSLRQVLDLLATYVDLFKQKCQSCGRILSAEAHLPPVARVWSARRSDEKPPGWEPWHPMCLQR